MQSDPPLVQPLRKNSACKICTHKISIGAKKPPPTLHFAPTRPRLSGEWAAKGGASPPCGEAWKLPDSGRGRERYLCGRKATAKAAGCTHGGPVGPLFFLWCRQSYTHAVCRQIHQKPNKTAPRPFYGYTCTQISTPQYAIPYTCQLKTQLARILLCAVRWRQDVKGYICML